MNEPGTAVDFYAISADDLNKLRRLMTRLHSERRMSGDEMRDAGHTLECVIRACIDLPVP